MYYVERVNIKSGEFALCNTENSKRIYFDFDQYYYGKNRGSITNSLKKKFPLSRVEIIKMVEEKYFQTNNREGALENAVNAFYAGAVDMVRNFQGKVILSR